MTPTTNERLVLSKPWWQSKTLWLNVGLVLAGAGALISANYQALGLPSQTQAWITVGGAIVNLALRIFLTNSPIEGTPADRDAE